MLWALYIEQPSYQVEPLEIKTIGGQVYQLKTLKTKTICDKVYQVEPLEQQQSVVKCVT